MTDDSAPFWPSKESALADLQDRELQARIRAHYKAYNGSAESSEKFFRAKEIAAEQDAQRKWGRRRA